MAVTYLGYEPPRPPETPPEPPPEAPPAEEIVDPDEPEPPIPDNPGAVPLPPVMPDDPSPVAAAVPPLDPPDSGVVPDHAMAASMAATSAQDREDRLKAAIGRHLRYPESARRRGEEGRLAVHLVISPDGRAEGLSITPADASARLVRAVFDRRGEFLGGDDQAGLAALGALQDRHDRSALEGHRGVDTH